MSSLAPHRRRVLAATAGLAATALVLTACSGGNDEGGDGGSTSAGGALTIGTTDKVTRSTPPAGTTTAFAVKNQVFPFLMNTPYGSPDVEPDIAESAEFTAPTEYTVKLKPDLKWANGNDLTSSDVKFSFDRQLAIADENGPSSLLYNLDSVDAVDDTTVVFHLKSENDQIFPQILSSPVWPIVDDEVFSADALTPDTEIVDANTFAGQYTITSYAFNELISYRPTRTTRASCPRRRPPRSTSSTTPTRRTSSWTSRRATSTWRSAACRRRTSPTWRNDNVKVVDGPGGEIRYITFNFDTQPYGARPPGPTRPRPSRSARRSPT